MIFEDTKKEPEDIFKDVEPAAPPMQAPPVPGGRPVLREVAPGAAMPPVAPRRGGLGKFLGIFFIIVLIAVVSGAVFYFLYWKPSQTQPTAPTLPTAEEETVEEGEPTVTPPVTTTPVEEEIEVEEEEEVPEEIPGPTPSPVQPQDTDGDGLNDDEELALGTDPDLVDTDGDGLSDRDEVRVWDTNPLNVDTDGDGYDDKTEIDNGFNPNGPGKLPTFPGA